MRPFTSLTPAQRFLRNWGIVPLLVLLAVWTTQPAYADNWESLTGAETLREFVSDATATIELRDGVTATGHYFADGTAKIEAWGETFDRTWKVVGDDQVCYSSYTDTNCYTFERNLDVPGNYRVQHVETGELTVFQIAGTDLPIATRVTAPDSEGGLGSPSADEIAAQLSNPNTTLGSMNMLFDYVAYDGDLRKASRQSAWRGAFQPSLPYPLSGTTNLFVRPLIPIIFSQDVPNSRGEFDSEGVDLGDIGFDMLLAKTVPSIGAVFGVGVVGLMPTATEDALGLDQWLLGPEVVAAIVRKWGVVGLLVTHQWDVAGENDFNTSITGGQYFYTFNLHDGWQINASPIYSYNHKADSDNKLTFPVGLGASKTTVINGRPWKFGVQFWHYVASPDLYGPDWQIRLNITPVVALPW
jgi:hypothetical protein